MRTSAAAGAAAAVVSNVDDAAMHAAREGGGTSIGDARGEYHSKGMTGGFIQGLRPAFPYGYVAQG